MITKYLPYLVLGAGILQVAVPAFIINQGFFNEVETVQLYIQPAEVAFAIWGLIYTFASIYAVYQVIPHYNNKVLEQNRVYALLLFLGSSLWLWASNLSTAWLWVTVPILVAMAYCGYRAVRVPAITKESLSMQEIFFSWQVLIIYAAWVNIAQFVNIGSMLTQYQLVQDGTLWVVINVLFLLFVCAWLWSQFRQLKNSVWYGGVVVWALVGVFIANDGDGSKVVMYLAAILTVPFIIAMGQRLQKIAKQYRIRIEKVQ